MRRPRSRTKRSAAEVVGEHAVERIEAQSAGRDVETPAALVSPERPGRARIEAEPHLADDRLGERRHVAQPKVQALPCKRMDHMGRVADEGQPLADKSPRNLEAKRKGLGARGEANLAQFGREAELKLAREVFGFEREKRSGARAALVPDDARPAAGKRQDRERAGGQEMLLCTAFMIALMGDGGDDAGLVVIPADGRDARKRDELRPRAVGGDRKARAQRAAVAEVPETRRVCPGTSGRPRP